MTIILPTEEELSKEIEHFKRTKKENYNGIRGTSVFHETVVPKALQKPKIKIHDPEKSKKITISYSLSDEQKKSFKEFVDPLHNSNLKCFTTYSEKIAGINLLSINEGYYIKSKHCLSSELYKKLIDGIESVVDELEPVRFSFEKFISTPHSIIAFADADENGIKSHVRNKMILEKIVFETLYQNNSESEYAKRNKVDASKDLKIIAAKFKKKITMDELSKAGFPLYLEYVAKELPVGKSSSIFISEITTLRNGFESKYTRRYFI